MAIPGNLVTGRPGHLRGHLEVLGQLCASKRSTPSLDEAADTPFRAPHMNLKEMRLERRRGRDPCGWGLRVRCRNFACLAFSESRG